MTTETARTHPIHYDPFDYGIDINPHPVWRRMREEQPLHWNERYGFWSLSRFQSSGKGGGR